MEDTRKEELANEMLVLRADIEDGYAFWERTGENRQILVSKFAELLDISDTLRIEDPVFYDEFENNRFDGKGLLKSLKILNQDLREGLGAAIAKISPVVDETVGSIAAHFKTNEHYAWQTKNPTTKVTKAISSFNEESKIDKLLQEFLPSVKAEEMSDLLAFAVSGKLSENYEAISLLETQDQKITMVKQLMAQERLHIKVDFSKLSIVDETEKLKQNNAGSKFSTRGIASQSMIDSAFLSADKSELICVCSTANKDTASQKDQLFRIFHTLNEANLKGALNIAGASNPKINLVVYNRAFFCTQDKEDATAFISAGPRGGVKKVDGFHSSSSRSEFEKLIAAGAEVSKQEMDHLNGLATLSMIGNGLSYPRFPYTFEVSDIVNANPFTVGADTLWLKEKFEEIRNFTGIEREQKFFEFMVDYVDESVGILNKLKSDVQISSDSVQTPLIKNLTESLNRTLVGMSENFTSYNLGQEYVENSDVFDKVDSLKKKVDEFNEKHPNTKISKAPVRALKDREYFLEEGERLVSSKKNQEAAFCDIWNKLAKDLAADGLTVTESDTKSVREVLLNFSMHVLNSDTHVPNKIQDLHEDFDKLTMSLYTNDSSLSRVDRAPVYRYFLAAASGLMSLNSKESQEESVESFKNNSYFKKTQELLIKSSPKRKIFDKRVQEAELRMPGSSVGLIEADKKIVEFMNKVSSPSGAMDIISSGGYELAIQKLTFDIEKDLKVKKENSYKVK